MNGLKNKHGCTTYVGMLTLEVGTEGAVRGFEEFGFSGYCLEEAVCCAASILVGMFLEAEA